MSSLPKLAVVSLAIIAIGALQFVMPAFSNNPNTALNASTKVLAPDSSLSNLPVKDFHSAQSGTLYFINEQVIQDETVQQHSLSPVLKTKVDIKVTGIVARTKLTQTFRNAGTEWVSALYVFPLPENAAVDHLLMTIGDRKIEGVITEKDEAKKRYLQAKAEGKKVSLIAQQRPNIFSNRIANIGPGETIEVSAVRPTPRHRPIASPTRKPRRPAARSPEEIGACEFGCAGEWITWFPDVVWNARDCKDASCSNKFHCSDANCGVENRLGGFAPGRLVR